jgi:hypothetical protein
MKFKSLTQCFLSNRRSSTPDFATAMDGRREIGCTAKEAVG